MKHADEALEGIRSVEATIKKKMNEGKDGGSESENEGEAEYQEVQRDQNGFPVNLH